MSLRQILLAGSLVLGAAQAQSTFTPAPTAQELLRRVTGGFGVGGQAQPDVLLGSAPADLRAIFPPGSRVIGTVINHGLPGRGPDSSTVYLDSSLTPRQVISHFATVLGSAWKQSSGNLAPFEAQGGFQQSATTNNVTFYRTKPPQILRVSAQMVGSVTQIDVSRQEGQDVERIIPYLSAPPTLPPGTVMLPKLSAPEGSIVTPAGSGNNGDSQTQNARIETKLNRQAVMEHYAAQLRQAGWTLATQANVPAASSTLWTFKQDGRDRLGILIIAGVSPYSGTLISQGTR